MYYDDDYDYEMYDDIYDDEAIIEAALDIYDEYDVSMEEAIDIAMEKVYRSPGGYKEKKLREKDPDVNCVNSSEYRKALMDDYHFWEALRNAKNGGNNDPDVRERYMFDNFGWKQGKNALRKFRYKDTVIDRDNPTPKPTPSAPTPTRSEPTPTPKPTPSAPTPTRSEPTPTPIKNPIPTPEPTPSAPIKKRRINPKTGIAVGAGAAALGAGGVALYKYRKKKLAQAAKAQREAEKEEAKAAMKREEAENAVAQAKEASMYFDYD